MKNSTALSDARRLLRFLAKKKASISPLLILTHDFPDPDALGTAYALQQICKNVFKIPSVIAYRGEIGRMENKAMLKILKIPARKLKPTDFKKFRYVALVDTQPAFKNNPFPPHRQAALVVDQHASLKKPHAQMSVINTDCGATSVILAQAVLYSDMTLTPSLATALVYGIISDTLNLYRTDQEEDLQTYLKLLRFCDLRALSQIQNPVRTKETYISLGKGIQNARVYKKLIVSHLGPVDSPDLVSQVADFLIRYKNMSWCLCTGQNKGKIYTSLRTATPRGHAGTLLRSIFDDPNQAGGHESIAGGSLMVGAGEGPAKFQMIQDDLVKRLVRTLRLGVKGQFTQPFKWS